MSNLPPSLSVSAPGGNPLLPEVAASDPLKPNIRTTEFWLVVAVIVLDSAAGLADIIPAKYAALLATITGVVHTVFRQLIKLRAVGFDESDLLSEFGLAVDPKSQPASTLEIEHKTIGSDPELPAGTLGTAKNTIERSAVQNVSQTPSAPQTPTLAILLLLGAVLFTGCFSTTTANIKTNARHAAINQVLKDSGAIIGTSVVRGLSAAVVQEASTGKVNWQQAAGASLQIAVSSADISNEVSRVKAAMDAATQGHAPQTVTAAVTAYSQAIQAGADPNGTKQAIANVIFAQTGAPPANPAEAISQAIIAGQTNP